MVRCRTSGRSNVSSPFHRPDRRGQPPRDLDERAVERQLPQRHVALDLVRPAGWITKVGWGPQPLGFSLDPLVKKNVTLQGSFSHNWPVWERVLELLGSGRLNLSPILGGVWPLQQWHEAFETMHSGAIAKAVLKPGT